MKYFTIAELCRSEKAEKLGIDNTPTADVVDNLTWLVTKVLDPLRELYGYPINVSSGYRCKKVNSAVSGSKTSDHLTGCAADICVRRLQHDQPTMRKEHKKLFQMLVSMLQANGQPFNQIIWEKGNDNGPQWIHVACKFNGNRNEILRTKDGRHYYRIDINGNKL